MKRFFVLACLLFQFFCSVLSVSAAPAGTDKTGNLDKPSSQDVFAASSTTANHSFDWPVNSTQINSPWGHRICPIHGEEDHDGVDIGIEDGSEVYATTGGVVSFAGPCGGYGNLVIIDHGHGIQSYYAHNSEIYVEAGMPVMQGDLLALTGDTGDSEGGHTHFEIRVNGESVDPLPWLNGNPSFIGRSHPDMPLPWGIEELYKMGSSISQIMKDVSTAAHKGYQLIKKSCFSLFWILCILDVTLPTILGGMTFSLKMMIEKVVKYGMFTIFLAKWWDWFVDGMFLQAIVDISGTFTGEGTALGAQVSQPQMILQKGIALVTPALNKIAQYGALTFMKRFISEVMPIYAMSLITILFFLLLAIHIMVAYIEFFVCGALTITTLPFGAWSISQFLPKKGIDALVHCTLKLLVTSIMVGFITLVIKDAKPYDQFKMDNIPAATTSTTGITGPEDLKQKAAFYAQKYGVPVPVFWSLIQQESTWNPEAVGGDPDPEDRGLGLCQITPGTAEAYGIDLDNIFDVDVNLDGGAKILADYYQNYADGDWANALAAYNGGPGNMAAGRSYAQEVLARAGGSGTSFGGPAAITVDQWIGFMGMCLRCIALVLLAIILPKDILGAQKLSVQGGASWIFRKIQWLRA